MSRRAVASNARKFKMKRIRAILLVLAMAGTAALATDTYRVVKLVSDQSGFARRTDPNLVNPWGLAVRPNGNIMVAINGSGLASVYTKRGRLTRSIVSIPAVTGLVQNFGPDFVFTDGT